MTNVKPPADSVAARAAKPAAKARRKARAEAADTGGKELKKAALVDQVAERAGLKKTEAKAAVEAVLAVLGESVAAGRALNLPPLGRLRVARTEEKPNGSVSVLKLRTAGKGKDPLAEPEE
ncbi:HU family DNA-binding protein [Seohaeicola nanhaiensis]|uniref:HU family DNA-binding protein n=1 Tax=Seohaeicola nanhaiensis TaxID=1387282 RepID=A0ABV9KD96_9RHOB